MYLELLSIHLLVVSCHCFASYTIFRGLFDSTNGTTTAPVHTLGRMFDGIEEIMPLSRAESERKLIKRPTLAPLTERPRITTLVKPRTKELHEHKRKPFLNGPRNKNFALAWVEEPTIEPRKIEVPTRLKGNQHNYPAAFDESLTMPVNVIAENLEETSKLMKNKPHLHFKPDIATDSTVGSTKVENTTKSVTNNGVSVRNVWHWMLDYKTNSSGSTSTITLSSTTMFPNTSSAATPLLTTEDPTQKFVCPEEEQPANIGPYEVPTEKDLVLFTKNILLSMFDSFHQRTFQFLRDIKEASKAAIAEDKSCVGDVRRYVYRHCLREISTHYEQHIKKLVNTLETDRHAIKGMTEGSVCKLNEMKKDPVHLIKTLAVEELSLQFALPGFLRLISSCRRFCDLPPQLKPKPEEVKKTKQRQSLEKEAMLKYMLTRNEYLNPRNKYSRNRKRRPQNYKIKKNAV